jgi:prevent-host-death family protein
MSETTVLVTAVGAASGSKTAAAALACAGSEPDRPGLLIDLGGRAPRPTLVASTGARELEERLAIHLPQLRAASRGQTCHLAVADDPEAFESVRAALPLVRDSVAVIHLPPARLQEALADAGIRFTAAMLRSDLDKDRALTALAVRDLVGRGLRTKVSKHALGWVHARRALFGVLPSTVPGALPPGLTESLLESKIDWSTGATMTLMTKKLTQRELRNNSGEIMRALDQGEDFIVTRNGRPVGELRPYRPRQHIPRDVFLAAFEGAPHIDYEKFRQDIDAYADQDPTPRG